MKKSLFFVAIATLFIASCQKEVEPASQDTSSQSLTITASAENLSTPVKGTINSSNQFIWKTDEKIGLYVNDGGWIEKNQPFHVEEGGATTANFIYDYDEGVFTSTAVTAAFYPWQGTGSSKNNIYDDGSGPIAYFKLPTEYWSYDNGDMLTPLVAPVNYNGAAYDPISFKHAGAAVKLTVNNLVSGTYAVKMTVYNKQITGDFHVNPANAGTDALALDAAENTSLNSVTLNSWKSSGAFSWVFPVPELTTPKLKFEITDENGVPVWSKSLAAQSSNLERGDILVMPAISVTAYKEFDEKADWGVCGTHNSWSGDTEMVTDGTICIAKSISFAADAEFKVRTVGNWGTAGTDNFGWSNVNSAKSTNVTDNSGNIKVTVAGTYDVIFNSSSSASGGLGAHEIRVVQSKYPYPMPKESATITIDGSFTDWTDVTSESAGNTTVKVVSDNTKVSFYVKITGAASSIWDNGGGQYVYALFDLDGDSSNDVNQWGNYGDFVLLLYPYGGSSASPAIITSSASSSTTWICQPTTSPCTVSNISLSGTFSDADGSGNRDITYEFSIPRSDMPTIPSTDPITITIKGSKISSNVSISRRL